MRILGTVSAFALLMASITALFYLMYLEPGSSSPQKRPGIATVIETRSGISKNAFGGYGLPEEAGIIFDADGCRVLNPILEKKADEMAASERKTLMYAIKTIHDPFSNTQ